MRHDIHVFPHHDIAGPDDQSLWHEIELANLDDDTSRLRRLHLKARVKGDRGGKCRHNQPDRFGVMGHEPWFSSAFTIFSACFSCALKMTMASSKSAFTSGFSMFGMKVPSTNPFTTW